MASRRKRKRERRLAAPGDESSSRGDHRGNSLPTFARVERENSSLWVDPSPSEVLLFRKALTEGWPRLVGGPDTVPGQPGSEDRERRVPCWRVAGRLRQTRFWTPAGSESQPVGFPRIRFWGGFK